MIPGFIVGTIIIGVLLDLKPAAIALAVLFAGAMVALAHMG